MLARLPMTSLAKIAGEVQDKMAQRKVDASEIYVESHQRLMVQAKEGQVDAFSQSREIGVAVRMEHEGKLGFAYTTDLSRGALERMVNLSYNGAKVVEPKDPQRLPNMSPETLEVTCHSFDEGLSDRPTAEKIACALKLERIAKDYDPRVKQVRGATYQEDIEEVFIWNSHCGDREYRRSLCEIQVMVMAADRSGQESAWEMDFSPFFEKIDPEPVAAKAAADAVSMLQAGSLTTGRYPAVLDRGVVAACLGILSPSFLADSIQKKKSSLVGKLGTKVYASGIDLIDDGLYNEGYLSAPFDGEGIPSQTTTLVSNGTLKAYLYDTVTAEIDGQSSTGNSIRSGFKEAPRPGTRNFYLKPGSTERTRLLQGMDCGIEICDVIGIHTANAITGDFSVGAQGYRIVGGQRKGSVRGFAISGNLHDLLSVTEELGSDLKFYGSIGAPSIRVSTLDVGGL